MTCAGNVARRTRLKSLLASAATSGARFLPARAVDAAVTDARACWILKHDVHAVDPRAVVEMAAWEMSLGIEATWLFMVRGDPSTGPADAAVQLEAMRRIDEMGHQVGLHVDPYHWIARTGRALPDLLRAELTALAVEGLDISVGTTHGNAAHRHPDSQGFGTPFEFFEELGRQPDHPQLARMTVESAEIVRANRLSLGDVGISHWLDMPLWSHRHGFAVTAFISDNRLGRDGTWEILVHPDQSGDWVLADRQPPGSRTWPVPRSRVSTGAPPPVDVRSGPIAVEDPQVDRAVTALAPVPLLMLLHPQFYV